MRFFMHMVEDRANFPGGAFSYAEFMGILTRQSSGALWWVIRVHCHKDGIKYNIFLNNTYFYICVSVFKFIFQKIFPAAVCVILSLIFHIHNII